ncbi:MAG: hypothetical protein LJF30_24280 [Acidobacteria bacterium]|nr:hypothetical protein [Acidobacteriota bacterium]
MSRLRAASPGDVPEDVAQHLATCERCQERVLFGPVRRQRPRREMPPMPSSTRALVLLALMAAVIVVFFVTLQTLIRRL